MRVIQNLVFKGGRVTSTVIHIFIDESKLLPVLFQMKENC